MAQGRRTADSWRIDSRNRRRPPSPCRALVVRASGARLAWGQAGSIVICSSGARVVADRKPGHAGYGAPSRVAAMDTTRCRASSPFVPRNADDRRESPRVTPDGQRVHARIAIPSSGNALRSIRWCAARRRRLVVPSDTLIQPLMVRGSQPRSRAICRANRRRRSIEPSRSLMSTSSVLSSMTSSEEDSACQQSRSIAPRSPLMEYVTSGATSQPWSVAR
jgi:hypothetical protein